MSPCGWSQSWSEPSNAYCQTDPKRLDPQFYGEKPRNERSGASRGCPSVSTSAVPDVVRHDMARRSVRSTDRLADDHRTGWNRSGLHAYRSGDTRPTRSDDNVARGIASMAGGVGRPSEGESEGARAQTEQYSSHVYLQFEGFADHAEGVVRAASAAGRPGGVAFLTIVERFSGKDLRSGRPRIISLAPVPPDRIAIATILWLSSARPLEP